MGRKKTSKYEVIADFPASMHAVGDIIEVYEENGMASVVEIDWHTKKYDIRDFPHLFKRVELED